MKKVFHFASTAFLLLLLTHSLSAQVSINTDNSSPDPSAGLDVKFTNKGFLPPRMNTNQRDGIVSPATGLVIFNTDCNDLQLFNGTGWIPVGNSGLVDTPGAISGNQTPCMGAEGETYTITALPGAVGYTWTSPIGSTIINGQGTTSITVNFGTSNGAIFVSGYGSCWRSLGSYLGITLLPLPAIPVAGTHVPSATQIIWNWDAVQGAIGYKFNAVNDYSSAEDMGTMTSTTETGLACNTGFIRYVWSYNACASLPATLSQTTTACSLSCGSPFTVTHTVSGGVAPVAKTVTYGTVTSIPGEPSKCWITSNLGSDHQATAVSDATETSAGWYWQFNHKQGFKHDGATRTPNSLWIYPINENFDWQAANDPCALELGNGWRIPTFIEWTNVDAIGSWSNWNGAWGSDLKLHTAGLLLFSDGSLAIRGSAGLYWSNTQAGTEEGSFLYFSSGSSSMSSEYKADGFPIRCLRESGSASTTPTITTSSVSNITQTTATCGGNVTSDGGASVTARGVCWSTVQNPTTSGNYTMDGSGSGNFTSSITGLMPNTTYYVRGYATNIVGTAYGNQVTLTTFAFGIPCPDNPTITDPRDGKIYNTVQIGLQCWMAQNLNIGTKINGSVSQSDNGTIEKYCYNDDNVNCTIYGGLYQWGELMNYTTSSNSTPSGRQGICPSGWHVPSDAEWTQLTTFLGGQAIAGGTMKETGILHWASPNTGATNSSGFTALPSGSRFGGNFNNLSVNTNLWAATEASSDEAYYRNMVWITAQVYSINNSKTDGNSGRCIQD